jgi:hypothetical protein
MRQRSFAGLGWCLGVELEDCLRYPPADSPCTSTPLRRVISKEKGSSACRQSQEAGRSIRHRRRPHTFDEAFVGETRCQRDNCSDPIAWRWGGLGEGWLLLCSTTSGDEGFFQEGKGVCAQTRVSDSYCANAFGFCAFNFCAFIEHTCSYGPHFCWGGVVFCLPP